MGKIRLLADEVASQVAAGEVVERPASIVKELAENSLDAGATRIDIDFARAGMKLISVRDDGCGMEHDDALLSLERHATSKLRSAADLSSVRSMGFRGEALPSIASVSRFRLLTREKAAPSGTEILVEGGRVRSVLEAGCAPGTLIEARDLFFNVPARGKFVRGEETESAQILQAVQGLAISAPATGFSCRRDGKEIYALPPAPSLDMRLRDLFGARFLDRLLPLGAASGEGIAISGFVAKPGEVRRDRLQQFVVVNGRPVASPEISGALREAYSGLLSGGTYPIAVLVVEMETTLVDCNVHPAKKQVRFARPEAVRAVLFDAVSAVLRRNHPPVSVVSMPAPAFRPHEPELPVQPPQPREPPSVRHEQPAFAPREPAPEPPPVPPAEPGAETFRVLGRFGVHYFALEGPEGLVLLDVRSASERIAFERLLRQMEAGEAPCQRLLVPEIVELPVREHAWICENTTPLRDAGFLVEPFGGMTVKIEGMPALAGHRDPGEVLHEVAATLRAAGRLPRGRGLCETVARAVCRSGGGESFSGGADGLLAELLKCELPYASPFGQPTMIQFSFHELERKFGRAD